MIGQASRVVGTVDSSASSDGVSWLGREHLYIYIYKNLWITLDYRTVPTMEHSRVVDAGASTEQSPQPDFCTIHICPTTGGEFHLNVPSQDTIDSLKKAISQRLKLSKERISLLFKDRYVSHVHFREMP